MTGEVRVVEPTGQETPLSLTIGAQQLAARFRPGLLLHPLKQAPVWFRTVKLLLFGQQPGKRYP